MSAIETEVKNNSNEISLRGYLERTGNGARKGMLTQGVGWRGGWGTHRQGARLPGKVGSGRPASRLL